MQSSLVTSRKLRAWYHFGCSDCANVVHCASSSAGATAEEGSLLPYEDLETTNLKARTNTNNTTSLSYFTCGCGINTQHILTGS